MTGNEIKEAEKLKKAIEEFPVDTLGRAHALALVNLLADILPTIYDDERKHDRK
jgi:hypothetical protein